MMESLLMVKKSIIDSALKTSIYVMDFTKQATSNTPDTLIPLTSMSGLQTRCPTIQAVGGNPHSQLRSPISVTRTNGPHRTFKKGYMIKT
jgi:hypothetical protein